MALNYEFIEGLYKSLDKSRQKLLVERLFKNSRQSIRYFQRNPNITLTKLEILSDFFGLPWDAFRAGNRYYSEKGSRREDVYSTDRFQGADGFGHLMNELSAQKEEIKRLEDKIAHLNELMALKDMNLKTKDELIQMLKDKVGLGK